MKVKPLITASISVVLVVSSFFFGRGKDGIEAGAGEGVDQEVTTIEQLSDVLYAFADVSQPNDSVAPMAYGGAADAYTSATVRFETTAVAEVSLLGVYSTVAIERQMTAYFAGDAVYYEVQADVRTKSGTENVSNDTKRWATLDMELYMDDTHSLLRFNDLQVISSNKTAKYDPSDMSDVCGKWYDMSTAGEAYGSLVASNASNYQTLALLGRYIWNFKDDGFAKIGRDKYELNEESATAFCVDTVQLLELEADASHFKDPIFALDLSNARAPRITIEYEMSADSIDTQTYYGQTQWYVLSQSAAEQIRCEIAHINNTQIYFSADVETYDFQQVAADLGSKLSWLWF